MDKTKTQAFPLLGLLALTATGFIAMMTETLPAGLLPQITEGLNISEALAGQLVTLYGFGSLVAAVPVALATQSWRRRPLLILTILVFLIFNTVTALSTNFILTLLSRFCAGVAAGVVWGMLAGYALRMVSEHYKGRAIALASAGIPIALSIGVPVGTFLGATMGWRFIFGIMSFISLILIGWILWKVPDFSGQPSEKRTTVGQLFKTPGVIPILIVNLSWGLAHNILYTYVAPFLANLGLEGSVEIVLLVFGLTALIGIWLVGALIDRWLRLLVLISLVVFAIASLLLVINGANVFVVYLSVVLWGASFGGSGTILQTVLVNASGEKAVDIALPISATFWNLAITSGGVVGGLLLDVLGATSIPWAILIIILVALVVSWRAKKHGFRSTSPE